MSGVVVNGAFRSQRVTGQQRYATEIADRLLRLEGVVEARPDGRWKGSAEREWAWTLVRLPRRAAGSTLVSLTSRAPLSQAQALAVHDLFVLTHPEWYSRRYIATHAPVLRAQLRRAEVIIAVSEPAAEEIHAAVGREAIVAPNAPSDVFRSAPTGSIDPYGLTPGEYLLTVGSLDPRKNLDRLAQAYGALSDATRRAHPLVVVGGGASIYRDSSTTWPAGMTALGYVSDEDLAALYRDARAVVFPSLAEGFGLPLVEAAAAGARHLVISELAVFRWICGDGATYVNPGSVGSIAEGLAAAVAGNGPAPAVDLTRFTWEGSASRIATALGLAKVPA
ncbi:glycosyltransferase family 1 protein [Demequina sp. NBRC 110051]|uniref:glycosyltransferase family 4 protein n=1 Tax=Demequina sp. NBRC 110051 TaxID=1570340 RepID=UPI00117EE4CB|nr:glycosyltransferase family 1 protein [Demequina sp. NBRC 110051]